MDNVHESEVIESYTLQHRQIYQFRVYRAKPEILIAIATFGGWVAMDPGQLLKFAAKHGSVSILHSTGQSRTLPSGDPDIHDLVANAHQFLWDGTMRSRREMEELVLRAIVDCSRDARNTSGWSGNWLRWERDRREKHVDSRYESPALGTFKDHRMSHH